MPAKIPERKEDENIFSFSIFIGAKKLRMFVFTIKKEGPYRLFCGLMGKHFYFIFNHNKLWHMFGAKNIESQLEKEKSMYFRDKMSWLMLWYMHMK